MIVYEEDGSLIFSVPKTDNSKVNNILEIDTIKEECLLYSDLINSLEEQNRFYKLCKITEFPDNNSYPKSFTSNFSSDVMKYLDKKIKRGDSFGGGYNFETRKAYLVTRPYSNVTEVFELKMLHSPITQFFVEGFDSEYTFFPMKKIIKDYNKNVDEVSSYFDSLDIQSLKKYLYENYPDFAIFYYEIYPYITLNTVNKYDINELRDLRDRTESLRINTQCFDEILNYVPMAKENTKVLSLLNKR